MQDTPKGCTVLDGQEMPGMAADTVISAPGKLRQESDKLKAALGYIVRCCLQEKMAEKLKQFKCPLTDDWIKHCIHMVHGKKKRKTQWNDTLLKNRKKMSVCARNR